MSAFTCEKCGKPMAVAETICHSCGHPAPQGRAAQVLKSKAESAFEQGALEEAIRQMSKALEAGAGLPQAELGPAWRKLGIWQEKFCDAARRPDYLALAEASYRRAFEIDDHDQLAHQLFINASARQGHMGSAAAHYQGRLAKNPEDEVAKKQLGVIKLAADIKAAPPPKPSKETASPSSFIERILTPSPTKWAFWGVSFVSSLAMMFFSSGNSEAVQAVAGNDLPVQAVSAMDLVNNPKMYGLQAALCGAALIIMWRNRK
jgi:hypothetical protein